MKKETRIFIARKPQSGFDEEFAAKLFGIAVLIRNHHLIVTQEPVHSWEGGTYWIENDELYTAFEERYGPSEALRFRPYLPVGQVTRVPVECCEIIPHPTASEGD